MDRRPYNDLVRVHYQAVKTLYQYIKDHTEKNDKDIPAHEAVTRVIAETLALLRSGWIHPETAEPGSLVDAAKHYELKEEEIAFAERMCLVWDKPAEAIVADIIKNLSPPPAKAVSGQSVTAPSPVANS